MYNFVNLDDEALSSLAVAVFQEQKRRIQMKIESYPYPPKGFKDKPPVDSIRHYREVHGCTLMEAKMVVEHWINKGCPDA